MIKKQKRPTVNPNDITYLYHSGYWDGPLSGMAVYKNEKLWFNLVKESWTRRLYALYRLTPNQLQYEEESHRLFQQYVGCHSDYTEGRLSVGIKRDFLTIKPQSEWKGYYEAKREQVKLEGCELVGYYVR